MLELEADQREYYRGRIERFLALAGKGYEEWDHECTLRAAATVSS
jgi:hypothetical protein